MQIFDDKKMCNGCRACEQICPEKCILMKKDDEGFLYPEIDESLCKNCKFCIQVCEAARRKNKMDLKVAYAAKNMKEVIRKNSSSGGVFYDCAAKVISKGGIVFGAIYDIDFSIYHKGVDTLEDLKALMGSKYAQSDTKNTYQEVKKFLNAGRLCLYSGTPCQIAGLKAYLQCEYDNLVCIAVICHGVPSPEIWKRYINFQKGRYGEEKIKTVKCREKYWGWRNFSIKIEFLHSKHVYHELFTDDLYMKGFMQNLYLRPSCYCCQIKGENQNADIIIGDYWGIEKCHPKLDDGKGVSAVIVNSQKGMRLFQSIKDNLDVTSSTYEQILRENIVLETSVPRNKNRKDFFEELSITGQIDTSIQNNLKKNDVSIQERYQYQYPFIMQYLKNKTKGKELSAFFLYHGFYKIAIYALTEFAELLYDDLFENVYGIQIVCVGDKGYEKFPQGFRSKKVVGIEKLAENYKKGEIDVVINCSVFHENEVFQELISKGIHQEHIISVINSIFMTKYI